MFDYEILGRASAFLLAWKSGRFSRSFMLLISKLLILDSFFKW
jgi:hypothetical protein